MGFNSTFKGLKIVKNPGNGRLNNLNVLVLNVLKWVHELAIYVSTRSCCLACVIVFVHRLDTLLDHNSSIAITGLITAGHMGAGPRINSVELQVTSIWRLKTSAVHRYAVRRKDDT